MNRFGQCCCGLGLQSNMGVLTLTDINHNVSQPSEMQTTNRTFNRTLFHFHCSNGIAEVVRAHTRRIMGGKVQNSTAVCSQKMGSPQRERSVRQGILESSSYRTITTHPILRQQDKELGRTLINYPHMRSARHVVPSSRHSLCVHPLSRHLPLTSEARTSQTFPLRYNLCPVCARMLVQATPKIMHLMVDDFRNAANEQPS